MVPWMITVSFPSTNGVPTVVPIPIAVPLVMSSPVRLSSRMASLAITLSGNTALTVASPLPTASYCMLNRASNISSGFVKKGVPRRIMTKATVELDLV